jgi:hypothetical protein
MLTFMLPTMLRAAKPTCFDDGTCFDLARVNVSVVDVRRVAQLCYTYPNWKAWDRCIVSQASTSLLTGSTNASETLFNVILASELYCLGFGLDGANAALRANNGTNVPALHKEPILLTGG